MQVDWNVYAQAEMRTGKRSEIFGGCDHELIREAERLPVTFHENVDDRAYRGRRFRDFAPLD